MLHLCTFLAWRASLGLVCVHALSNDVSSELCGIEMVQHVNLALAQQRLHRACRHALYSLAYTAIACARPLRVPCCYQHACQQSNSLACTQQAETNTLHFISESSTLMFR